MRTQVNILCDKVLFFMVIPFFIWSFLGGHKQYFLGVNTDHIATFLAAFASILIFLRYRAVSKVSLEVTGVYTVFLFFCFFSLLIGQGASLPSYAIYAIFTGAVYFFISVSLANFFSRRATAFFDLIAVSGFISSLVLVLSYILLGNSSWGRMTIPVYHQGGFDYFPQGYTSSSDPNVLGYFLGLSFLTILWQRKNTIFGGIWPVSALFVVVGVILTQSRSALLAFALSTLVYLLFSFDWKVKLKFNFNLSVFSFLFIVMALSRFELRSVYESILLRYSSFDFDRFERLQVALNYIGESPFYFMFGHGAGVSRDSIDPHNFYLSTTIDTGVLSFLLLGVMLFYLVYKVLYVTRSREVVGYAFSVLVFFLVISFFYWQVRTYYFVVMIFLVLYMSVVNKMAGRSGGEAVC